MRRIGLVALVMVMVTAGALWAKEPRKAKQPKKNPIVDPTTVQASVSKVTNQMHWFDSLDDAKAEAKRTGKMVLWMHALGELTGTT